MPAEAYGVVLKTFWTDPDIKRKLTREQKHLFLYLCTSPHSNMIGVYYCPIAYMANEADMAPEEIRRHLAGPLSVHVTYDEQTEEVFVHALAKHGIGDSLTADGKKGKPDHRIEGVRRQLQAVHSVRLQRAFLARYGDAYRVGVPIPEQREAPSEALESPLVSPSEALAVTKAEAVSELNSTNPSDSGEPASGVTRGELLGVLRKICGPRQGRVSEATMRTNASCLDMLAGRKWTYAQIHEAAVGTRMLCDRGKIPSIPAGTEWSLRVLTDATPDVDPIQRGLDAFRAQPPPPSTRKRGGSVAGIGDVLDFSKFSKGA